jgi:hypothetical protein
MFDANNFMNQTIDKPMETDFALPPEGEFRMMIGEFPDADKLFRTGQTKSGPNEGKEWVAASIPMLIEDDAVKAALGRDKVMVFDDFFLDFDDTGALAFGPNRNIKLGKLRAAVGQNQEGSAWAFHMLQGAGPFLGKIAHQDFERRDGTKGKKAVVTGYARLT